MESTTAEPNVVQGVLFHEELMQAAYLFLRHLKCYISPTVVEVLAIKVHHEVVNEWGVVVHPVMLRCLCSRVAVGCEVHIATTVLASPVGF